MQTINNSTEKEYRDNQVQFGHLDRSLSVTDWLNQTYGQDLIKKSRYFEVAKKFLDSKSNLKVLEIAAGVGDFVVFCSQKFPQHSYYAQELSEQQLKNNINEVMDYFGVTKMPELSFGPAENLAYKDNQFDVVFIKAAVHHFEDPNKGFEVIHRILKPGGQVVFFEDPVCLDIPIYRFFKQNYFALDERKLGINEHIYSTKKYESFGHLFSKRSKYLDEVLVGEYDKQQKSRQGIKAFLGNVIRRNKKLFYNYMIWRFSPVVFVFEK